MLKFTSFICLLIVPFLTHAQKAIPLGASYEIHSDILGENRTINIYLPDGYADSVNKKYDVIYLLDGGVDQDYIHFCGLVQFFSFPWINGIPESIVVGISNNNNNRERDMSFPTSLKKDKERFSTAGGSSKFMSFLEKDLFQYMSDNYRINENRTVVGESLSGLFACEVLLKNPAMFNKYLIISPSLWWDDGSLLNYMGKLSATFPATKTGVYLAVGKEGLTPTEKPHVMEVDANIMAEKIQQIGNGNVQFHFDYFPQYNHGNIGHFGMYEGLRTLHANN